MLRCHWPIAIYESSTRANISRFTPDSPLRSRYGDRPINYTSGPLTIFFYFSHFSSLSGSLCFVILKRISLRAFRELKHSLAREDRNQRQDQQNKKNNYERYQPRIVHPWKSCSSFSILRCSSICFRNFLSAFL
jgi:hypothetical protein